MKKIMICLSFLNISLFGANYSQTNASVIQGEKVQANSQFNSSFRTYLKEEIHRKLNLMPEDEFNTFIEPYLNEAQELLIFKYLNVISKYDNHLLKSYLNEVLYCNTFWFNKQHYPATAKIASLTPTFRPSCSLFLYLDQATQCIQQILSKLKKIGIPLDFNIKEETDKTVHFFKKLNENYYKQLSLKTKMNLFFKDKGKCAYLTFIASPNLLLAYTGWVLAKLHIIKPKKPIKIDH